MDCASVSIDRTIIARSTDGAAVMGNAWLTCCDIYGNDGGPGSVASQIGTNGNISEDPLFCDPAAGNFRLEPTSPCTPHTPPNPECGLIGAHPVGCDPMAVPDLTIGRASLSQIHSTPNPFTHSTRLVFSVPGEESAPVALDVFDLSGRLVRSLVNADRSPGTYYAAWDGTDHAGNLVEGGVYLCRLCAGSQTVTGRILLIR